MGRILKAHQIRIDTEHPVFISNNKTTEAPAEKRIDTEYDDGFADEVFKALSPERLAGSGEKMVSKNKPKNNEDAETAAPPKKPDSALSADAKKTRSFAALEAIRVKELEIEALKQELQNWESELQAKEKDLSAKEKEISETLIKRRQEIEAEASNTLKLAKEAASSITQSAQAEAEAIRKTARAEETAIREKAYNEGHKEGYAVGESKGISAGEQSAVQEINFDWQNLMKESEMLVKELQTSRMGILKSSEEEMLKLVVAFAKTVIKTEPLIQPEIVLKNLDAAINKISETDKIILRVNMRDKNMCEDHKNKFLSKLASISELSIVEDNSLSPGGIKIETEAGTIDATVDSQAKELEKALLEKYNRNNQS